MKIISLASYNSGEACSVFTCIKKYFYNNDCITDFFSYLEVSLESINQILLMDEKYIDSYFNKNNEIYLNHTNNYSIIFKNFDKMISHHDLIENNEESFNKVVERYKRRYYRFIDDIKKENKIFFIRYGKENPYSINYFITLIKMINPLLEFYFINVYYEKSYDTINLSKQSGDKELFSEVLSKNSEEINSKEDSSLYLGEENTMNLYLDKELFSGTIVEENTMNLYLDKELFSGTIVEENTINLSKHLCVDQNTIDKCIYINFLDYLDKDITYDNDLFYRVMQYDWKCVYNIIYNLLDSKEKKHFFYNK
jgi:hypothetical protein